MEHAAQATSKRVSVVGYCYGGTLAWLAAARLRPAAAVGYYGGRIANYAEEKLTSPVMLHFGTQDAHIPAKKVERVKAAHPEVEIYSYEAGHGFNCEARGSYNADAAMLARERTLTFLTKHLL